MKDAYETIRDAFKRHPIIGTIVGLFILLFVAGAIGNAIDPVEESDQSDEPTTTQAAPAAAEPETETAPEPEPGPTDEDLREALDDADPTDFGAVATDLDVKDIERSPKGRGDRRPQRPQLLITLETPEGGFEGASVDDLDGCAGAAFKAVYADADWRGGTTLRFIGGLVDTRTGKELPDAETGVYHVAFGDSQRIDWDNATAVDWSLYRLFAHSALED